METIPPKTTSKYLRGEIAGNVFGNHFTDHMAVSVSCTLHNSSRGTLTLFKHYDWHGHGGTYPNTIAVDGDAVFTHVADEPGKLSQAAVVYRREGVFDWLVSWYVAPGGIDHVFTLIGPPGGNFDWNQIKTNLEKGTNSSQYKATAEIDGSTSPATLTASINEGSEAAPTA